jgi:hypothetical protein
VTGAPPVTASVNDWSVFESIEIYESKKGKRCGPRTEVACGSTCWFIGRMRVHVVPGKWRLAHKIDQTYALRILSWQPGSPAGSYLGNLGLRERKQRMW